MTTVLLVATGRSWESEAIARLEAGGGFVVRRCVDAADALAIAAAHRVHAAVLALPQPGIDADFVDRLARLGVRAVGVVDEPGYADAARELGLSSLEGIDAVATLGARLAGLRDAVAVPAPSQGRVVAVWGAPGAPGRTFVAVNLAAEVADLPGTSRCLLIDADTYGASIAQQLGLLDEVSGLLAAARAANQGRLTSLAEHVVAVSERWHVLTGLPRSDLWRHVRPSAWERILAAAASSYTTVIVDTGFCVEAPLDPEARTGQRNMLARDTLAHADQVLAVGAADPVGITRLVRSLDELDIDASVDIVINRHDRDTGWRSSEVVDVLRALSVTDPLAVLPYDHRSVSAALAAAQVLREYAPRAVLRRCLQELAGHVAHRVPATAGTPPDRAAR